MIYLTSTYLQLSSVGDIFGWIQSILTSLGVWSTLTYSLQAILLISVTMAVFRFFRA